MKPDEGMSVHHPSTTLLVTGGAGYIGSQLVRDLVHHPGLSGFTIRILDNMQRAGYRALMDLPDQGRYQFVEGDILDPVAVRRALAGVTAVVHLAAIVKTPNSFDHPIWMEQVNHWGTARLIEHCLEAGVSRFIFTSSASVYGPGGPFDENNVCRPVGPYAQSKWQAEQAILAAAARGLRPTLLRVATVFGCAPSMRFDAVANRFAYLAGVGRPLTVYGSGEQTRPMAHVCDVSSAIGFCLADAVHTIGEIFNVVEANVSVLDLVETVRRLKPNVRVRYTEQDVPTHLSFAVVGHRLVERGWTPRYTIESAMAEMIAQFRHVEAPADITLDFENGD